MKKVLYFNLIFIALLILLPLTTFAKLTEIKLITNANCNNCKTKIEKALKDAHGVKEASLDLPTKIALVKFDSEATNPENLISELQKVGYDAKVYEGDKDYGLPEHKDDGCKNKKSDSKCKDKKTECKDKK